MKKSLVISSIFGIAVLGAVIYSINYKNDDSTYNQQSSSSRSSNDTVPADSSNTQKGDGNYIDYSEAELAAAKGEKILFFHAPWCSQCRSIENGINSQGVPSGITIIKVDYDSNQKLRQKYGVTLQTTFVKIDDQNNEIEKFVAYNEPTFEAVKRDFL